MEFNIGSFIKDFKKKIPEDTEKIKIKNIFLPYLDSFTVSNFDIIRGVIFLKNISSIEKTKITLHKKQILLEIKKTGAVIRDII